MGSQPPTRLPPVARKTFDEDQEQHLISQEPVSTLPQTNTSLVNLVDMNATAGFSKFGSTATDG